MNDSFAKSALAWLLTYSIHSTLLLGLAWLVTRRRSVTAYTRDFVWKVALVGGVVTSLTQMQLNVRPTGSFALTPASLAPAARSNGEVGEKVDHAKSDKQSGKDEENVGVLANASDEKTSPANTSSVSRPSTALLIVAGWAILAFLLAVFYVARRLILVGRLANRRAVVEGPLPAMLDSLCRAVGHRSQIALTSVNTISSPVALGTREICVPDAALTELEPDQQRGLLAHELAHLKRRDPLWLNFASLMERVFFFQPLNRVARKELQSNAEYLCDDWAATHTGSGLPLAHCLARVAEWIEASPLGVPVAGMAEQRSLLVTRIARLIEGKTVRSPMSRFALGACSFVLLAATTAAAPGVQGTAIAATQSTSVMPNSLHPRFGAAISTQQLAQAAQEDPAVIAALIERLKDTDAGVRKAAASSLGNLKSKRAVNPLIALLTDRNKDVRAAAVEALGDIEDPSAVSAIARAVSDESPDVRQEALNALSRFTESEEVKPSHVTSALRDVRPQLRSKAAEILGELGDRSVVPTLIPMLKDSSADVRHEVVHALEHLNDRSAGTALLTVLHDENADVRGSAVSALRELKFTIPERELLTLFEDSNADVRKSAIQYVGDNSSVAFVPALKKLIEDSDSDVREEAVDALGQMRDPAARAALRAALNSEDPKVRRKAAEKLGERQ